MQTVTKIFHFSAGHRLSNYEGNCKRLHGHNYECHITVASDDLDKLGMVVDFGVLKDIFKNHVDSIFDHKTLLFKDDELNQKIGEVLGDRDDIVFTPYNPTAENMARHIKGIFEVALQDMQLDNVQVFTVLLYETPSSYAEIY